MYKKKFDDCKWIKLLYAVQCIIYVCEKITYFLYYIIHVNAVKIDVNKQKLNRKQ